MRNMAAIMHERSEAGGLNSILKAIEDAADHGKTSLSLYRCHFHELGFDYSESFNYKDEDLEKLKEMGFEIKEYPVTRSFGFFKWKKTYTRVYHTVRW